MMLEEELLQKIYSHPAMRKIPVGYYSSVAKVVEDILKDIIGESVAPAKKIKEGSVENE